MGPRLLLCVALVVAAASASNIRASPKAPTAPVAPAVPKAPASPDAKAAAIDKTLAAIEAKVSASDKDLAAKKKAVSPAAAAAAPKVVAAVPVVAMAAVTRIIAQRVHSNSSGGGSANVSSPLALPAGMVRPDHEYDGANQQMVGHFAAGTVLVHGGQAVPAGAILAEPCTAEMALVSGGCNQEHMVQNARGFFVTPTEGSEGFGSAHVEASKATTVEELRKENGELRAKMNSVKGLVHRLVGLVGDDEKEKEDKGATGTLGEPDADANDNGSESRSESESESGPASGEASSASSTSSGSESGSGSSSGRGCGKHEYDAGKDGCKAYSACTAGTYMAATGTLVLDRECSRCTTGCPAGSEMLSKCGKQSDGKCHPCLKGTFKDVAGNGLCRLCPKGTFAPEEGMTACKACTPCAGGMSDAASPCTARCDRICTTCKEPCAPGKTHSAGLGCKCMGCPEGSESREKFEGCTTCGFGQFAKTVGVASCGVCPPGKFTNTQGAKLCTLCPAGKFSDDRGSLACTKHRTCRAGETLKEGGTASSDTQCA